MFAHGFGCDQNMWRLAAPRFEDEFRVVLFDHVGAGHADPNAYDPDRHSSLAAYADDVLGICHELTHGLLDDVLRFQGGDPRDDIAIVAVRVP